MHFAKDELMEDSDVTHNNTRFWQGQFKQLNQMWWLQASKQQRCILEDSCTLLSSTGRLQDRVYL